MNENGTERTTLAKSGVGKVESVLHNAGIDKNISEHRAFQSSTIRRKFS